MKKKSKYGRNPKLNPKTHCVMVRFDDVEWNRFLTMYEESNVYAKAVFLKAHFFGQKFQAVGLPRPVPLHRHELQSGCERVAHPLLGEEGDGVTLQAGEVYHRPCEAEPGDCGAFKGNGEVLPNQIRLTWHRSRSSFALPQ